MISSRCYRGCTAALTALVLAAPAAAGPAFGRKLKQITFFADTPDVATSTSYAGQGQLRLGPDGTVRAAGGVSRSSSTALAAALANLFANFTNRPQAASSAYTQSPLTLSFTLLPSLSYGLAEGKGDIASTSDGQYAVGEFGYNPISNNLGASASAGTSNSLNVGQSDTVLPRAQGSAGPFGFSGVEFVGTADDQTDLANARTSQLSQALAYPTSTVNPINPLTCAQTLVAGWTMANYDLGSPGGPLPRGDPPALIPYCLQFFNFATLDNFASFIDEQFGVDNGPFTNDFVVAPATTTPSSGSLTGGSSTGSTPGGFSTTGSTIGGSPLTRSSDGQAVKRPGGAVQVRNSGAASGKADKRGNDYQVPMLKFADTLNTIVASMGPGADAFFTSTPIGKSLMDQAANSPLGKLVDGSTQILSKGTLKQLRDLVGPVQNLTQALSNLTGTVAANVTNLLLDGAVHTISSVKPLIQLGVDVQNNVTQPISKLGADLAAKSMAQLRQQAASMPDGRQKTAVQQLLTNMAQQRAADSKATSSLGTPQPAAAGR